MKKRYIFNVGLGLLVFFYLEYRLGFRRSYEALLAVDFRFLAPAVAAFFLSQLVRLVKWRFFYKKGRIRTSFAEVALFYFNLKLFGMLTPGRIGEFLPALTAPSGKGSLFSFTGYDRLTEAMATLTVAIVAFTVLLHGTASTGLLPWVLLLIFLMALLSYFLVRNAWMMGLAERLGRRLEKHNRFKIVRRILAQEERIAIEIRFLQRTFRKLFAPHTAAPVFVITFTALAVDMLFWWLLFRSIGVSLSPITLVAAMAVFNVTGFFSPTPGGIGVSDSFFVLFLKKIGVEGAFGTFVLLLRFSVIGLTVVCRFGVGGWIAFRAARRRAAEREAAAPDSGRPSSG
ncbi:MAG: flippase-like domain-containing protein [Candidatus Eisenbacteria bacterium]|nr:flippase-like domain-containing protein [Candidatus Eisenbacteria bacterium]